MGANDDAGVRFPNSNLDGKNTIVFIEFQQTRKSNYYMSKGSVSPHALCEFYDFACLLTNSSFEFGNMFFNIHVMQHLVPHEFVVAQHVLVI